MRIADGAVWIESETPLSDSLLWTVPLRLIEAVATGKPVDLGHVPLPLAKNLPMIRDIFAVWIKNGVAIPVRCEPSSKTETSGQGVSLFFSGGVDSFHSLVKHRDEIDQLVLVHGFDIPLAEKQVFTMTEAVAREAARIFDKKLIIVKTNLHWEDGQRYGAKERIPCGWGMYHGAALTAVAYALAPIHRKVIIASSYAYTALHPWGSHPLLDPLWSTDTLELIHDGGETRVDKLRVLMDYPEAMSRLRVCWENTDQYNCCQCEKCIRTMLGLRALGVKDCPAFPGTLTPGMVSSQILNHNCVYYWRELLDSDLPADLKAAVRSAVWSYDADLPPRTGRPKREIKRLLYSMRNAVGALGASIRS